MTRKKRTIKLTVIKRKFAPGANFASIEKRVAKVIVELVLRGKKEREKVVLL